MKGVLISWLLLLASSHAAVVFTAGSGSVVPGGDVVIPITVSGSAGQNWISAGFQLTWDTDVLTITAHTFGPVFESSGFAGFNNSNGTFSWANAAGTAVPDPSTLVSLTFTAAPNAPLGNYSINFVADSAAVGLVDYSQIFPGTVGGSISAVPEPVNCALALFACVLACAAPVRRLLKR